MCTNLKKSFFNRILIVLMLAAMLMQPVFALAEDGAGGAAQVASEQTASEQGQTGQAETKLLKETGEAVKCHSGVMVAPVGDPAAKAPDITAKGAVLYSLDTGSIVYSKDGERRLEPYSTTKLLTCWLALENLGPDEVVTASEKATQTLENGTTIWLKEGEKMTVMDLVYGAMLESGNDAAHALGEAVSGSEKEFAELMNKTVEEWGCKDTHFVNANGWRDAEHYTTAEDMAIITAKCLENKELRDLSVAKSYTIPETNKTEARKLKNYFLHVMKDTPQLTGGKTGTWDDDDCGVVASFSEGGLSEVVVLLGATEDGRPEDARKLIEFSHEVTPGFAVPAAGKAVETAWVKHGAKTRLDLAVDAPTYVYPQKGEAKEISTEVIYDKLEAPVKKGDAVGQFQVYVDDKMVAEHKLIATEDVEVGWFPSYLYISNRMTLNILKAIGVILLFVILLSLVSRGRGGRRRRRRSPQKEVSSHRNEAVRRTAPASRGGGSRASSGTGRKGSGAAKRSRTAAQKRADQKNKAIEERRAALRNSVKDNSDVRRISAEADTERRSPSASRERPVTRSSSAKDKKEARERLREKYRDKH